MGGWNLWKLTAIAMVLVTATAVVTGLVVAYWSGSAPGRGRGRWQGRGQGRRDRGRAGRGWRHALRPQRGEEARRAVPRRLRPLHARPRLRRLGAGRTDRRSSAAGDVSAGETLGVGLEQPVHLPHRRFGRPSVVGRAQVLEDRPLRLARLLLLDRLVHRVVHAAPLGADPVVLDEGPTDGLRDLDNFLFEERRRAERGAPRDFVSQDRKSTR